MSQSTPSDKTELKPLGYVNVYKVMNDDKARLCFGRFPCDDDKNDTPETFGYYDKYEVIGRIEIVNKPSETPMSKEESMRSQEDCCGEDYQKIKESRKSPNSLPSSPTDKCRESFEVFYKQYHIMHDIDYKSGLCALEWLFWQDAWQASRKECEEELQNLRDDLIQRNMQIDALKGDVAFHQAERVKASHKRRIAVDISVEHIQENARLKEELSLRKELCLLYGEVHKDDFDILWHEYVEEDEKVLSDGSLRLRKHLKRIKELSAALQIDQLGGKKEEEVLNGVCSLCGVTVNVLRNHSCTGVLPVPSSTPVSSHVGTKEPTAEECLEWVSEGIYWLALEKHNDGYVLRQLIMPERSKVVSKGKTPLEAIRKAMSKSTDGTTCGEAPLNSEKEGK